MTFPLDGEDETEGEDLHDEMNFDKAPVLRLLVDGVVEVFFSQGL